MLTVPEFLRKYFYQKDDDLLDAFMRTGHIFYQDVASTWLKTEVEVGDGVVLQTAGRSSNFNPHLHILGTSGGKTKDGQWKEFGYIDFNLFHKDMDGLSVLSKIKKASPGTIVTMISAYGDEDVKEEAKNYGAFSFLDKPLYEKKIFNTIKKATA